MRTELTKTVRLIQNYKFRPPYEVVWWFLSGLLKGEKPLLEKFFETLEAPEDLAGINGLCLHIHCLEECGIEGREQKIEKIKAWCQVLFAWEVPLPSHSMVDNIWVRVVQACSESPQVARHSLFEVLKCWVERRTDENATLINGSSETLKPPLPPVERPKEAMARIQKIAIRVLANLGSHTGSLSADAIDYLLQRSHSETNEKLRKTLFQTLHVLVISNLLDTTQSHKLLSEGLKQLKQEADWDKRHILVKMLKVLAGTGSLERTLVSQLVFGALTQLKKDGDRVVRQDLTEMLKVLASTGSLDNDLISQLFFGALTQLKKEGRTLSISIRSCLTYISPSFFSCVSAPKNS